MRFKKLAKEKDMTHTQLLQEYINAYELMKWHAVGFAIVMIVIFLQV